MNNTAFSTKIINADFQPPDAHGAIGFPVYRNAAFEFASSQDIIEAFKKQPDVHAYSRISNPTVANFERKIKAATGAECVIALSSGMAAITNTFFAIAHAGGNIVSSPYLFSNTFSFFKATLSAFGVETRFVDATDLQQVADAVDENTCAFFAEVLTNPHLEVANFPEISKILRKKNIPIILDTTLIPWCAFDAKKAGVDVEIVSTTKYVSGGATSTGGVIVDYGTHDWATSKRLGAMAKPDGLSRFAFKLRSEIVRNLGACMPPDTAYLHTLGLETLQVRYEQMSGAAYELAQHFSSHPKIAKVSYPKLETSPYNAISGALFSGNPGAMLTFSLASQEACFKFMDALKIVRRATNLFDNKTLVIHPFSTIYGAFTPEMKKAAGIEDKLVRLSIGLENVEDIKADLEQALGRI